MSKKKQDLPEEIKLAIEDLQYPYANLVDPTDCTCSKADLKEFGFCLCGSTNPPKVKVKQKPKLEMHVDFSGSMDDELIREFLELLGELPKPKG